MSDPITYRRLPSGDATTDQQRYRAEWLRLARACCRALGPGWEPHSYDPGVVLARRDGVSVRLPTVAALALAVTSL